MGRPLLTSRTLDPTQHLEHEGAPQRAVNTLMACKY